MKYSSRPSVSDKPAYSKEKPASSAALVLPRTDSLNGKRLLTPLISASRMDVAEVAAGGKVSQRVMLLSDGRCIPRLGLGTASSRDRDKIRDAVEFAFHSGVRLLDCAALYGNEKLVGEAIASCFSRGNVEREDIFVASKLWNTEHRPHRVLPALKRTLEDLQLTYLDLYMIHWPTAFKEGDNPWPLDDSGNVQTDDVDFVTTWQALEKCVDAGLVRSLGVSNFSNQQILRILDIARHKPVISQVECHPYFTQADHIQFCQAHDIAVISYSPLASFGNKWVNQQLPSPLDDSVIKEIGQRHGKTPAEVILKWGIDRNTIVIPGSVSIEHILLNSQVFDIQLTADEVAQISALNKGQRFIDLPGIKNHREYPFTEC